MRLRPLSLTVQTSTLQSENNILLSKGGEIQDTKTFNLTRNSSKFVAWEVVSLTKNELIKPTFVAQSWPALYFSKQISSSCNKHFYWTTSWSQKVKNAKYRPKTCNETMLRDKLRVFFISYFAALMHSYQFHVASVIKCLLKQLTAVVDEVAQTPAVHWRLSDRPGCSSSPTVPGFFLLCFVLAFSPFVSVNFASSYVSGA